jgi:hemerythrin-like domain-containing protein
MNSMTVAVLHGLGEDATDTRPSSLPDFELLRAMLFHVDELSEKRHHRIETEVLFAKLRARTPMARHMLDRLDEEHEQGERRIRSLQYALLAFEMLGKPRRESFEREAESYAHFYVAHMASEEQEMLPLANHVLTHDDREHIDAAFEPSRYPQTGREPETDYAALFDRIKAVIFRPPSQHRP